MACGTGSWDSVNTLCLGRERASLDRRGSRWRRPLRATAIRSLPTATACRAACETRLERVPSAVKGTDAGIVAGEEREALSSAECQALLSSVTGRRASWGRPRWPLVIEAARHHRVVPLFAKALYGEHLPEQARLRLGELVGKVRGRSRQAGRDLVLLADEADRRDLRLLFFKGPALSATYYESQEARQFADLDVLVPKDDVERASLFLGDLGYRVIQISRRGLSWIIGAPPPPGTPEQLTSESTAEVYLRHHYHLPFRRPGQPRGVTVELHWDLFREDQLQLPIDDFRARAVTTRVTGREILTFSPVDNLLYLCLQTSLDGYRRIRLMKLIDIVRVADTLGTEEWRGLAARARGYCVEDLVLLGLSVSYWAFGRNVPDGARAMRAAPVRLCLLRSLLSPRALVRSSAPSAHAAWDWTMGRAGHLLLGRMMVATAVQRARKVKPIRECVRALRGLRARRDSPSQMGVP